MKVSDFDFDLPEELIASHPLATRDASRMLVVGMDSCIPPTASCRALRALCDSPARGELDQGARKEFNGNARGGACFSNFDIVSKVCTTPPLRGSRRTVLCGGGGYNFSNPKHQNVSAQINAFSRNMRSNMTPAEKKLWYAINNKKLGFKFRRQYPINNKYIADFICLDKKLILEIDGAQHYQNKKDKVRTEYLKMFSFNVVRFWNETVIENLDGCIQTIVDILNNDSFEKRLEKFKSLLVTPPTGICDSNSDSPARGELFGDAEGTSTSAQGGSYTETSILQDQHISDFVSYLRPGDVVVFNNSRVIPARFNATAADGHVYEMTLHTMVNELQGDFKNGIIPPTGICIANSDFPARGDLDRNPARNSLPREWWALAKKFGRIAVGDVLTIDHNDGKNKTEMIVLDKSDDGIKIRFDDHVEISDDGTERRSECDDVFDVLDRVGKMPLPPYMKREEEDADRERYQTVYSDPIGSMAAPTAGLHFTDDILGRIRNAGATIVNITLHVGAGTWMPVKSDDLAGHVMHSEWGIITATQADIINTAKSRGGRVFAIGTTSTRLLESAAMGPGICDANPETGKMFPAATGPEINAGAADHRGERVCACFNQNIGTRNQDIDMQDQNNGPAPLPPDIINRVISPFCGTTNIFITPGYNFKVVDVMFTNFHLPKSTLFMLVSAFAGVDKMRAAYQHAIDEKYRFFSYGDACLLFKKDNT